MSRASAVRRRELQCNLVVLQFAAGRHRNTLVTHNTHQRLMPGSPGTSAGPRLSFLRIASRESSRNGRVQPAHNAEHGKQGKRINGELVLVPR